MLLIGILLLSVLHLAFADQLPISDEDFGRVISHMRKSYGEDETHEFEELMKSYTEDATRLNEEDTAQLQKYLRQDFGDSAIEKYSNLETRGGKFENGLVKILKFMFNRLKRVERDLVKPNMPKFQEVLGMAKDVPEVTPTGEDIDLETRM